MRIVIADDYQNCVKGLKCFATISDHDVSVMIQPTKILSELVERFYHADVIVVVRERISLNEELLKQLPNLKLVALVGRNSKYIDFEACTRHGVGVTYGVSGSHIAPAECAMALMLSARRNVVLEAARMKAGLFPITLSHRLSGTTLGIYGLGDIGELVAKGASGLGMHVLIWGRQGSQDRAKELGYEPANSREDFFSRSDVISLHIRYNKDTLGIVKQADLMMMKPTALLINTARAELIESGALEAALNAGQPGFAAVDVYENEPILDGNHPLLKMDNVICLPHLGWADHDTFELYFGEAFEQVERFIKGEPLRLFNPEVVFKP
jgi:D-3-phosphoglycerate dehydrogenase